MRTKLLVDFEAQKTWAIVFDSGEEAMAGLIAFARDQSIRIPVERSGSRWSRRSAIAHWRKTSLRYTPMRHLVNAEAPRLAGAFWKVTRGHDSL
jgi:hypothetical protein